MFSLKRLRGRGVEVSKKTCSENNYLTHYHKKSTQSIDSRKVGGGHYQTKHTIKRKRHNGISKSFTPDSTA